jgi:hypothetical protein
VIKGDQGLEPEILLPGSNRFRLLRQLKTPPGNDRIVDGRNSEIATFGGYWRGRANRWFIATFRERAANNQALGTDWQEDFQSKALQTRALLLNWLELWFAAGKNTEAMMKQNRAIDAILRNYVSRQQQVVLWSVSGPSCAVFAADFKASEVDEAARLLLVLMFHPLCTRLNKCERCGCIYLGKTDRSNKRYCARACGNANRNNRPSVVKIQSERERIMMLSAAEAIREWKPQRGDRKRWIVSRVNKALGGKSEHIKTNWVTLNLHKIEALATVREELGK